MHEDVLVLFVVTGDETVTVFDVKPLYCADNFGSCGEAIGEAEMVEDGGRGLEKRVKKKTVRLVCIWKRPEVVQLN